MAHRRLRLTALLLLAAACSDPPPRRPDPAELPPPSTRPAAFTTEEAAWGKFHSKRWGLTVPLPDGKAWKIDDHHDVDLVAIHDATTSRLALRMTQEEGLMNRQRCEARARDFAFVPKDADKAFTTIEDTVHVGPEAYDSRVWVAVEAAKPGGTVTGHAFLFGSFVRRCLFIHLATSVPSAKDEDVLAARLAIGTERIVKAIAIDPPRTTDDATLPKEKPEIRR